MEPGRFTVVKGGYLNWMSVPFKFPARALTYKTLLRRETRKRAVLAYGDRLGRFITQLIAIRLIFNQSRYTVKAYQRLFDQF